MAYKELKSPNGNIIKVDSSKKDKIKSLINDGYEDLNQKKTAPKKAKKEK